MAGHRKNKDRANAETYSVEAGARAREWAPPSDYQPMTDEERETMHQYVHDTAIKLAAQAVDSGNPNGGWTLQEMANKALNMLIHIRAKKQDSLVNGGASNDVLEIRLIRDDRTEDISATDARA